MEKFIENFFQLMTKHIFSDIGTFVSWILLMLISILATRMIVGIHASSDDKMKTPINISIIIALGMTVMLFKQPYLDRIFPPDASNHWINILLFGGGAGTGWFIWYLRYIEKYSSFFYVFLLTLVVGFSWYARLSAPQEVQLTAMAFILSSLFKIAKDMMDSYEVNGELCVIKNRLAVLNTVQLCEIIKYSLRMLNNDKLYEIQEYIKSFRQN